METRREVKTEIRKKGDGNFLLHLYLAESRVR